MLEKLADYDEHLMEELLSDVEPPRDEVFADLARELAEGLVVPVLIGSAEGDNGIRRLLKALRHEVPEVAKAAARLGLPKQRRHRRAGPQDVYSAHGGKLSLSRVHDGTLKDGAVLRMADGSDARVGGIFALKGEAQTKLAEAKAGDTVALGRLEGVRDRRTAVERQDGRRQQAGRGNAAAGLPAGHRSGRPQRRSQTDRRHRQAARGRSLAASSNRTPSCTRWRWRGRAKST